jgi:hypothetical protein
MTFMIGKSMLDIVDLIRRDPELREFYLAETPVSHGAVWEQIPTQMHMRFWPQNDRDTSFNAVFRSTQGKVRTEVDVHFSKKRSQIPLKTPQMKLWDLIRTELALSREYGWHVWTGMTLQPKPTVDSTAKIWDQHHVFFLLRNHTTNAWGDIVGLHYDSLSFRGHWQETELYRDWRMTSRSPVIWAPGEL